MTHYSQDALELNISAVIGFALHKSVLNTNVMVWRGGSSLRSLVEGDSVGPRGTPSEGINAGLVGLGLVSCKDFLLLRGWGGDASAKSLLHIQTQSDP